MPKLTLVIGANATGKTYFIEQNYVGKGADILDIYDYQQRVYNEDELYVPGDVVDCGPEPMKVLQEVSYV